jgi:hypothetical protein
MQHLTFRAWFVLLNVMISSSINFPVNSIISFFLKAEKYSIVYVYQFFYPFIVFWAPRMILLLYYCEYAMIKHGCAGIALVCWFLLLWTYVQEWL